MMDKVITTGQTALIFPYSGSGHEISPRHYDFYDNLFKHIHINDYSYYGEQRCLGDVYAELPQICFYCVPGVWIDGSIDPLIEFNVPFYGDDIVFPELLVQCLDSNMLLPPRFHHLATIEPENTYDYDFPCVAVDGHLSNSIHLAPIIDAMQIEDELYVKKYNMGLAVYSAMTSDNLTPLIKTKMQSGICYVCLYSAETPGDLGFPCYSLGNGYYLLFFPDIMQWDNTGAIIPVVGLGEIEIKATHIVQKGNQLMFQ